MGDVSPSISLTFASAPGPCLRPVWVSSDPAAVRDKCDVRVCWIQGIYVKHMHRDKDVPPGTFGSVFFVQEQRCRCVPRGCGHQNDGKSRNLFLYRSAAPSTTPWFFILHFWEMRISRICRGRCFYQIKLTVNKCHFLTASVVKGWKSAGLCFLTVIHTQVRLRTVQAHFAIVVTCNLSAVVQQSLFVSFSGIFGALRRAIHPISPLQPLSQSEDWFVVRLVPSQPQICPFLRNFSGPLIIKECVGNMSTCSLTHLQQALKLEIKQFKSIFLTCYNCVHRYIIIGFSQPTRLMALTLLYIHKGGCLYQVYFNNMIHGECASAFKTN